MAVLPDGKRTLRICVLVLMQYTNVTDSRTDRHAPHDGIGHAMHSVAQQKLLETKWFL